MNSIINVFYDNNSKNSSFSKLVRPIHMSKDWVQVFYKNQMETLLINISLWPRSTSWTMHQKDQVLLENSMAGPLARPAWIQHKPTCSSKEIYACLSWPFKVVGHELFQLITSYACILFHSSSVKQSSCSSFSMNLNWSVPMTLWRLGNQNRCIYLS